MHAIQHESAELNQTQIEDLYDVVDWSSQTEKGDINELGFLEDNFYLRSLVTSTTENCLGQSCKYYEDCYVFKNRKAAMEADLIITNHHLLLADMGLRETGFGEVLPIADTIIFDEAHQLPELASTYFSKVLSSRQLLEQIDSIRTADREEAGDVEELQSRLIVVEKNIRDIRMFLGRHDKRIAWQVLADKEDLYDEVENLMDAMQAIIDVLETMKDRGKMLESCWQRIKLHYNFIENYIEKGDKTLIRWLEIRGQHFYLNQTPVNIAETFQQQLQTYQASNIFTSASLAIKDNFDHFKHQLGLEKCNTSVWDSPFDFKQQARLYLPLDLPEYAQPEFFDAFIERSITLLKQSKGRAFILFTSHAALQRASKILEERINYPLFIQGKASRSEMLNQFRNAGNAVLLGTNSFWEGVDVKGEALSLVIIDKLPFAAPDDPVLQARLNYLSEQGGNPFMDYQVPQAAIILKQGIGRLIRDVNDRGVCVICDKRIARKAYGKRLLSALPPMSVTNELKDVENFFKLIKNKS